MTRRPHFDDPLEAARVSTFIGAAERGRWRIREFDVTGEHHRLEVLRALHDAGDNEVQREWAVSRAIPPGHYVSLQRKATEFELEDKPELLDTGYAPVMSDTPTEIQEHGHCIALAEGRVLIHGLGLGVVVSALLAKPEVKHIDVVEIDPDVIALTGHYYDDPRVTIHRGSCLRQGWSPTVTWDYVWHDIWSHISTRNMDPETAEHGISYDMLFDMFAPHTEAQGAWGYAEALEMQRVQDEARARTAEWEKLFWAADTDERVEMVFEFEVREHLKLYDGRSAYPWPEPIPPQFLQFFEDNLPELKAHIRDGITREGFGREEFERQRQARRSIPIGNPNEALERTEVELS
jgi:hypothetical protein